MGWTPAGMKPPNPGSVIANCSNSCARTGPDWKWRNLKKGFMYLMGIISGMQPVRAWMKVNSPISFLCSRIALREKTTQTTTHVTCIYTPGEKTTTTNEHFYCIVVNTFTTILLHCHHINLRSHKTKCLHLISHLPIIINPIVVFMQYPSHMLNYVTVFFI